MASMCISMMSSWPVCEKAGVIDSFYMLASWPVHIRARARSSIQHHATTGPFGPLWMIVTGIYARMKIANAR